MPSTVSTPPRKRIRAKTMTSASASAGTSSTRRSALRNGKNGDRDKPKPVLKDKKNKKNKKERKEKKEKDKKDRKDKQGKHEDQKREKKENEERKKEKKEENEERKKEKKEKAEQGEKKLAKIQAEKAKAKAEEEKKLAKIQAEKAKAKAEEEKLAKIQAEKAKAKAEEEKLAKIQAEKAKAKAEEEKKVAKIQAEKAKAKAEEEKKVAKAKTEEEKKATKTKENGKDEKKIRFEPAKRRKIQHIFNTPERKKRAERSPARSVAETSAGSLTSKEKAEKRLAELQSLLKASDIDDDSSCPATDMEEFLEDIKMQTEKRHPVQRGPEDEELEEAEEEAETEDEEEEETEAQEEEKAEDQMDSSDCSDSFDGSEVEDEDEEEETEKEEDEGKPEDKETDPKKELALVACTQEAETTNEKLRNSSTNKREWDTFCRQAKSAGKMPVSLSEFYVTSKVELFNMWLDAEKDWDTCVLEVERIQSQRNISKRGWVAIQGKELKKRYDTEEKWEKVRADRVAKGLYYQDDDFPDDALESQRIIYV